MPAARKVSEIADLISTDHLADWLHQTAAGFDRASLSPADAARSQPGSPVPREIAGRPTLAAPTNMDPNSQEFRKYLADRGRQTFEQGELDKKDVREGTGRGGAVLDAWELANPDLAAQFLTQRAPTVLGWSTSGFGTNDLDAAGNPMGGHRINTRPTNMPASPMGNPAGATSAPFSENSAARDVFDRLQGGSSEPRGSTGLRWERNYAFA